VQGLSAVKSAALEFSGYGITVNGVEPGNILIEGMQQHRSAEFIAMMERAVPLGRLGTPQDVAASVALPGLGRRRLHHRHHHHRRWRPDPAGRPRLPAAAAIGQGGRRGSSGPSLGETHPHRHQLR
jgi:hypothetical protein